MIIEVCCWISQPFFGFVLSNLVPPSTCWLKFDNPAVVSKYNASLWKIIKTEGLDSELEKIHAKCKYPMTPAQQQKFERINATILEAQYKQKKMCSYLCWIGGLVATGKRGLQTGGILVNGGRGVQRQNCQQTKISPSLQEI